MTRREKLEQMLAGSPGDTFLLYALALARSSEGDAAGAIAGLKTLIETAPDYLPTYFQLAQLQVGPFEARHLFRTPLDEVHDAGRHAVGMQAQSQDVDRRLE